MLSDNITKNGLIELRELSKKKRPEDTRKEHLARYNSETTEGD